MDFARLWIVEVVVDCGCVVDSICVTSSSIWGKI